MTLEEPMDFGGTAIDIQDVISDDVISRIKGLNPDLGIEGKDPLYDQYARYRNQIENAELIIIDANSLNRSSIMNLDLAGDMSGVEDLPANWFQLREDTLELAFGCDDFGFDDIGTNEYEGFEDFSAFGDTEYSPYTNGIY